MVNSHRLRTVCYARFVVNRVQNRQEHVSTFPIQCLFMLISEKSGTRDLADASKT